ncbi:MAG: hypothetical protein HOW97_20845 [Catenulispora sp.]|nr:hypothetical protein [Catenulispora sp.]
MAAVQSAGRPEPVAGAVLVGDFCGEELDTADADDEAAVCDVELEDGEPDPVTEEETDGVDAPEAASVPFDEELPHPATVARPSKAAAATAPRIRIGRLE